MVADYAGVMTGSLRGPLALALPALLAVACADPYSAAAGTYALDLEATLAPLRQGEAGKTTDPARVMGTILKQRKAQFVLRADKTFRGELGGPGDGSQGAGEGTYELSGTAITFKQPKPGGGEPLIVRGKLEDGVLSVTAGAMTVVFKLIK